MYKFLIFLLGILFTSIGLFFLILYLNLFAMGYSFFEFVNFIIRRFECWLFLLGLIMLVFSLGRSLKNELLLRYTNKHERRKSI